MDKYYITFGQNHSHTIDDKKFHKDVVAVIEAKDYDSARKIAFTHFNDKFSTTYETLPPMKPYKPLQRQKRNER